MEEINPWGFVIILAGIAFLVNAFWENSPIASKKFRERQEERWGKTGLKIRLSISGSVLITVGILTLLKIEWYT